MSNITLFDYQRELLGEVINQLRQDKRTLAVLPTGGGKTATFSKLLADYLPEIGVSSACIVINREKLIIQISETLSRVGVKHAILAPKKTIGKVAAHNFRKGYGGMVVAKSDITILSVQSYKSHLAAIANSELIIVDECAHVTQENVWGKALQTAGKHLLLGFTATPIRSDKKELENSFDVMVQGVTMPELIEMGRLVPLRVFSVPIKLDVSNLRIGSDGDYTAKSVDDLHISNVIGADAIKIYKERCLGKKIIAFCNSINDCNEFAKLFKEAGLKAGVLHSKVLESEFEQTERDFRRGLIDIIFNVAIFSEGYDAPEIEGVFMLTPTKSLGKFHQCIGRALRAHTGKVVGYLFDFVGVTQSVNNPAGLPLPTVKTQWSLREHDQQKGVKRLMLDKNCTSCLALIPSSSKICPECGEPQETLTGIIEAKAEKSFYMVDGEMLEITENENDTALIMLAQRIKPLKHLPRNVPYYVQRKIVKDNRELVEILTELKEYLNVIESTGQSLNILIEWLGIKLIDVVELPRADLVIINKKLKDRV